MAGRETSINEINIFRREVFASILGKNVSYR